MYSRGTVVVAADPYGVAPRRPYLVVSDDAHPFAGEQYVAVGISTKEYDESIPLEDSFVEGRLDRESFVAPWAVVSLRDDHVERAIARATTVITDETARRLATVIGHLEGKSTQK